MRRAGVSTVYLVRHAATDWNDQNRWQCLDDRHLSPNGEIQARLTGRRLAQAHMAMPFSALYSSPLTRARQTAGIIGEAASLKVDIEPLLREFDCGNLSGMKFEDVRRVHKDFLSRLDEDWLDSRYPGGETQKEYKSNAVIPALTAIIARHHGERVIAVTHGGFIRAAVMHIMGCPANRPARGIAIDNCAYFVLEIEGLDEAGLPFGRVAQMNISNHLRMGFPHPGKGA